MPEDIDLNKSTTVRKSANIFTSSPNGVGGSRDREFGSKDDLHAKKQLSSGRTFLRDLFSASKAKGNQPELAAANQNVSALAGDIDEFEGSPAYQMEFASKSHGQSHYLNGNMGSRDMPGLKRHASNRCRRQTTTPDPGSYNVSDEQHSALPRKSSSDLSRESIETPLLRGAAADDNRSFYNQGGTSNRASFVSRQEVISFEKPPGGLGGPNNNDHYQQARIMNSRSVISGTAADHNDGTPQEAINCTRICNYREVKALFDEHQASQNDNQQLV